MNNILVSMLVVLGVAAPSSGGDLDATGLRATECGPRLFDLEDFHEAVSVVEGALRDAPNYSRDDALAVLGRTSAASGRFDVSAAAYAMFLNEFGTEHEYSERIAVRLADSLFPFGYDRTVVFHPASGPKMEPTWRMGYSPPPVHVRQSIQAFELAASLAGDDHARGRALLKLGWVHRALDDWEASTAAWDRCAKDAAPTKAAADALWLAAENLEWTNRPAEAAERLQQMVQRYADDARTPAATDRVENLRAEARRSAEWLSDPVPALVAEIESRASTRSPFEVYRSVSRWLQRRGEWGTVTTVSRWACLQDDWAIREQIASRNDLADALMRSGNVEAQSEAVQRLREIVEIAPDVALAVPAGLRCSRVLDGLGRVDETRGMFEVLAERASGSSRFEPVVLTEYADWLVKNGNKARAADVLSALAASHPDFNVPEHLQKVRRADGKEGGR